MKAVLRGRDVKETADKCGVKKMVVFVTLSWFILKPAEQLERVRVGSRFAWHLKL